MFVDLRDKVGLIGRLFSIESESQTLGFSELMIVVGVIEWACWGFGEVSGEVAFVAVADGGLPVGELAAVGVERDGALRVIIFESSGFGESKTNLRGRVIG